MNIKLAALAATAAFALPMLASAATISSPLFSNGDTTIDATGGSTVSGNFTLTVGPGEVCEWLRTQSDPSQPFTDTSVGGQLGYQEQVYTNVPFTVKVPPNTGTVYPTVQCAGTFGGNRSINGGDNVVVGPTGLGTIRVVANGSTSGNTGSSDSISSLADVVAQLAAQIQALLHPVTPPAPTVSPVCTAYGQAAAGTMFGTKNDANVRLQGFLLSQGMSIPALAAGAAFGFDGTQTEAARATFVNANHCI